MVVFDATFLLLALRPGVRAPDDPATHQPVDKARERIEYLIQTLSDSGVPVIIPTPALAETLVLAGAGAADIIAGIRRVSGLRVADFDTRAALECALLTDAALKAGNKRGKADKQPYQKVKVDRQIIAIAKVTGASTIYTTDVGLQLLAEAESLQARHLADLPMPPIAAQGGLF